MTFTALLIVYLLFPSPRGRPFDGGQKLKSDGEAGSVTPAGISLLMPWIDKLSF